MGTSRLNDFFISGPNLRVTKCGSEVRPPESKIELELGPDRLSQETSKVGSGSENSATSNSAQLVTDPSSDSDFFLSIHGSVVAHARHLPIEALLPRG
jgi:hypothetical protein